MQATYQSLAALLQLLVIATSTAPVESWIQQLDEYLAASDIGKYLLWALDDLFGLVDPTGSSGTASCCIAFVKTPDLSWMR